MREKVIGQHLASRLWFGAALAVAVIGVAGCDGDREPSETPEASPSKASTVEPSATLSPEDAVIKAYLRYWEVYSEALYELDETRLTEVMTGPRLDRALTEIQTLRGERRAVDINVENNPVLIALGAERAVVFDEYENRSNFIEPDTKEPLTQPGGAELIRDRVTLTRVEETWKVFDSVREAD